MAWWAVVGLAVAASVPPTSPPPAATVPEPASTTPVSAPPADGSDPLGCEALVHDPSGELDAGAVEAAATRIEAALGADVHVRAEGDLDGGLDARMAQLQSQCPTWAAGADRAPDLVVVMYSSTEREASVFYGAEQADALELRWEHAVDVMGPRFAAADYTGGVLAGLEALGDDPPVTFRPTYDQTSDADDETGGGGVPTGVWLLVFALVAVAVVRVAAFVSNGEWSSSDDGLDADSGDTGRSWSGSRRRSSWSSSAFRRSSSSRRSSSRSTSTRRSSRRSGGGTKRW